MGSGKYLFLTPWQLHLLISRSLVNGGVLAPNDPKRRYKYQLLDPVDTPYATIRFYYRPVEFLKAMGIVVSPINHSRQTSTTSNQSFTSSEFSNSSRAASKASSNRSPARSENSAATGSSRRGIPPTDSVAAWLRHHRLQKYTANLASISFDTLVTFSDDDLAHLGVAAKGSRAKLLRELATYRQQHLKQVEDANHDDKQESRSVSPASEAATSSPPSSTGRSKPSKSEYVGYCFGNPAADPSLRIITKESGENLALPTPPGITLSAPPQKTFFNTEHPTVSAPRPTASAPAQKTTFSTEEIKPTPPTEEIKPTPLTEEIQPTLPKKSPKKCRKTLKVQINGAEFDLEKDRKRPLSPFSSGGMLRRLLHHPPPSAPAKITAFGPTIDDEVNGMLAEVETGKKKSKGKSSIQRTTRAERGGGLLSKLLGKRIGRG